MESKVTATGVIINPDTPEAELSVEIAIDCPTCGPGTIRIPGHHLRIVRDVAAKYCDDYPELTKSNIRLVNTTSFDSTTAPKREDMN